MTVGEHGGYVGVPDAELLTRHAAGDIDAFGEVVRRHRDRLWAVALRTLGDPDEAADAVQDALISALRASARGSFRGESAVTTWLHRIVVNACLDRVRRRQSRPSVPLADDVAGAGPDAIAARETELVVRAALRHLPPDQAAAIVLVDLEGWSTDDAGEILGIPAGTVKSRCSRGRARLLPLLDGLRAASSGDTTATSTEQARSGAGGRNRGAARHVRPENGSARANDVPGHATGVDDSRDGPPPSETGGSHRE